MTVYFLATDSLKDVLAAAPNLKILRILTWPCPSFDGESGEETWTDDYEADVDAFVSWIVRRYASSCNGRQTKLKVFSIGDSAKYDAVYSADREHCWDGISCRRYLVQLRNNKSGIVEVDAVLTEPHLIKYIEPLWDATAEGGEQDDGISLGGYGVR